jgi:hypothetical protein
MDDRIYLSTEYQNSQAFKEPKLNKFLMGLFISADPNTGEILAPLDEFFKDMDVYSDPIRQT